MTEILRAITGSPDAQPIGSAAYQKFATFAFVCGLLVPDAARKFQRAIRDEYESRFSADATVNNITDSQWKPPCYTHEVTPPFGARQVRLHSHYPTCDYLRYLVRDLGYDGNAAYAAIGAHQLQGRPNRHRGNVLDQDISTDDEQIENAQRRGRSDIPSIYSPPGRRTKVGGGWKVETVVAAIGAHNWDDPISHAVFQLVYRGRLQSDIAAMLGSNRRTVYNYAQIIRDELRTGQAPKPKLKYSRRQERFVQAPPNGASGEITPAEDVEAIIRGSEFGGFLSEESCNPFVISAGR